MTSSTLINYIIQTHSEPAMGRVVCEGMNPYIFQAYPVTGHYEVIDDMLYFRADETDTEEAHLVDMHCTLEDIPDDIWEDIHCEDGSHSLSHVFVRRLVGKECVPFPCKPLPYLTDEEKKYVEESVYSFAYSPESSCSEYNALLESFRLFLELAGISHIAELRHLLDLDDETLQHYSGTQYEYETMSIEELADLILAGNCICQSKNRSSAHRKLSHLRLGEAPAI